MTVVAAPRAWPAPVRRGPGSGAVAASIMLAGIGFVIAAVGFAIPMAAHLVDTGQAVGRPQDVALVRSLAQDGWLIVTVGLVHAVVGLGILGSRRAFRAAAVVLAGSGIVVATVIFAASIASWGPFAGTGFARPGAARVDGVGFTLATVLFEAIVLVAVRSAGRAASEPS